MRKKLACFLLSICMLLTLLTACGRQSGTGVESNGVDYNQYNQANGVYAVTESNYIVWEDKIFFLEPTLTTPMTILCAKADCDHTDPNVCSAYLPSGTGGIFTWNNALYYITGAEPGKLCLYQMDVDGQNRKQAAVLDVDISTSFYTYFHKISCGHLVLDLVCRTTAGDVSGLYLFSMDDPGAEPTVIFSNEELLAEPGAIQEEVPYPIPLYVTEDWVFYMIEQGPHDARQDLLCGYQISTGETKQLIEDGFYPADSLSLAGDTLYWYDSDGVLYQIDLNSGEITLVGDIPVEENENGAFDDRWLYISGGEGGDQPEVVVYDFAGNEVQRLSCAELGYPLSFAFSTTDRVFFQMYGVYTSLAPVCFLEKDAIAAGSAKFVMLETD